MPFLPMSPLARAALLARHARDAAGDETEDAELLETQVYIGLNDADTKQQERGTEWYVTELKQVCAEHGVPFSFDVIGGGYVHDDGEYTEEQTIVLTFIDVSGDTIDEIARDLCDRFNQESVLLTEDRVTTRSVRA